MGISSTSRRLLFIVQKRCLKTSVTIPPSPLPPLTKDSNFAIQLLTDSCSLPLQSAISVSQKLQLEQKCQKKLLSVVNFFKDRGFNQTQIAKLIERKPAILLCRVDSNLKPKLDFLEENGLDGELLIHLLIYNYRRGIDSHMKPCLEFLKSYLDSDEKIISAVKRSCSWNYSKDVAESNVDFLLKEGMNDNTLSYLIAYQPTTLMQNHDRLLYAVSVLKKLGIQPTSRMFVHALRVVMCMSESTWKKKIEILGSFGCSEEEVLLAFKKDPLVMACSEEKLRKAMDFYVNTMKVDQKTIIGYPKLLMYAIESRIRPRYAVLKMLESKKLLNEDAKMVWLFTITEKAFLNKFVIKYEDVVPGLLDMYSSRKKGRKMDN